MEPEIFKKRGFMLKRKRIPGFHSPVYKTNTLILDDIEVTVNFKKVKYLRMKVNPNDGRVLISAPYFLKMNQVRAFAESKKDWIKQAHEKYKKQTTLNSISMEYGSTVPFLGKNFCLKFIENKGRSSVYFSNGEIQMVVKPKESDDNKRKLLEKWYRKELKSIADKLLTKWEPVIGIKISELRIKKMKTRWGTCNSKAKRIWLNLELIRYPIDFIETILVHEMIHFLEKGHNKRFYSFMTQFLPNWKENSANLNSKL